MRFDVISIFPEIFRTYLGQSLLKKAAEKHLLEFKIHNLRDFALDKHHTVDNRAFGGGRGMVMKIQPIYLAVKSIEEESGIEKDKKRTVMMTPRGRRFNQKIATEWRKLEQLILICGRYEGVDERVAECIADEKLSIGNYVLMGGEIPALAVIETISRLVPGVVGRSDLLEKRISKNNGFIEYPQYTRPKNFRGLKVPKILLSGDHKKIAAWREKKSGKKKI